MKPSEKATKIAQQKKTLGTAKAVAAKMDMSESTIGLYLKLAKSSKKTQEDIDNGIKTLSSLKGKKKSLNALSSALKEKVLEVAARIRYFTVVQMAAYTDQNETATKKIIDFYIAIRVFERDSDLAFFTLTSRGWAFVDGTKPKHFVSASAIHQHLLRNDIEIDMRNKNSSALFINTKDAWDRGIYPSVGEHALLFDNKGARSMALVMIDDYKMSLTRILKSLTRYHDKNKSVTQGKRIVRWCDVVSICIIYTIGERQKNNMIRYIEKKANILPVKPIVRTIKPYWEVR